MLPTRCCQARVIRAFRSWMGENKMWIAPPSPSLKTPSDWYVQQIPSSLDSKTPPGPGLRLRTGRVAEGANVKSIKSGEMWCLKWTMDVHKAKYSGSALGWHVRDKCNCALAPARVSPKASTKYELPTCTVEIAYVALGQATVRSTFTF